MKKFLLLTCLCSPLLAMDIEMKPVATSQFQLGEELLPLKQYLNDLINKEEYDLFCEAFLNLNLEDYHTLIKLLKNYLEVDREAHKEFVQKCYSYIASFIRNQEKPKRMAEDLFSNTEMLNSKSFEELRQLLVNDPYESEASIEPGSDDEKYLYTI